MNNVNLNYVLGFVVVVSIIFLCVSLSNRSHTSPYKFATENHKVNQFTLVAGVGHLNLDKTMMKHYISRLISNLEYVSKWVDLDKCEEMRDLILSARDSLQKQIQEKSDQLTADQMKSVDDEREHIRQRVIIMADVLFTNDQEQEENLANVLSEIVSDLEVFMYMSRITPERVDKLDIKDVDMVVNMIYNNACFHDNNPDEKHETEYAQLFSDSFQSEPNIVEGGIIKEVAVDFHKHQHLGDMNRLHASSDSNIKTRHKKQKNVKRTSLQDQGPMPSEKHELLKPRTLKVSDVKGMDPIRDRLSHARQAFYSERPDRFKPRKNTLFDDNDDIENQMLGFA